MTKINLFWCKPVWAEKLLVVEVETKKVRFLKSAYKNLPHQLLWAYLLPHLVMLMYRHNFWVFFANEWGNLHFQGQRSVKAQSIEMTAAKLRPEESITRRITEVACSLSHSGRVYFILMSWNIKLLRRPANCRQRFFQLAQVHNLNAHLIKMHIE